jgi:hypothetical protein
MALAVAGCGGEDEYENRPRPPAPISVAVSINEERVSVSPRRFGAGPIELVITNQSGASQQVTLETDGAPGSGPGTRPVETGPINPSETASVKADVAKGTYVLRVAADGVGPARLTVGAKRKSAQNELLQP